MSGPKTPADPLGQDEGGTAHGDAATENSRSEQGGRREPETGDGRDPEKASEGDAESDESGYRRDDYWREEQQEMPLDAGADAAQGPNDRPAGQDGDPAEDDSPRTGSGAKIRSKD